jgi:hypothetical protein
VRESAFLAFSLGYWPRQKETDRESFLSFFFFAGYDREGDKRKRVFRGFSSSFFCYKPKQRESF